MDKLKLYQAAEVTNEVIILRNSSQLNEFYNLIKEGKKEFILSWTKQSFFGKPRDISKIMSCKELKEKLENGEIKIYANGKAV